MVKYLQSKSEHHAIRQEGSARDFSSRQGLETQEGFVPFKFSNRGIGGKDPASAAGDRFRAFPNKKTAKAKCFDRWNRDKTVSCKSNIALRKKYCDSRTDLLCTPNSSGSQKPYHFGGSTFCMPSATFERLGQATDWFRASISLSLTVISLFTGVPVICA